MVPELLEYPKLKTTKGRTRVLSREEVQAIENELNPDKDFFRLYTKTIDGKSQTKLRKVTLSDESKQFRQDAHDLFILFCATGARFTEISKLEWQQVNMKHGTIHLYRPKVDNESVLVLPDKAIDVLKRRARNPNSQKYVFTGRDGGPRGYTGGALKRAIKDAGLGPEVTPHVIRHTVATRLLEAGLNIVEVQGILGHADMKTTRRYLHTSVQDAARKAADALNEINKEGSNPKLKVVK